MDLRKWSPASLRRRRRAKRAAAAADGLLARLRLGRAVAFDPQGSYTGCPQQPDTRPVQDADDL